MYVGIYVRVRMHFITNSENNNKMYRKKILQKYFFIICVNNNEIKTSKWKSFAHFLQKKIIFMSNCIHGAYDMD